MYKHNLFRASFVIGVLLIAWLVFKSFQAQNFSDVHIPPYPGSRERVKHVINSGTQKLEISSVEVQAPISEVIRYYMQTLNDRGWSTQLANEMIVSNYKLLDGGTCTQFKINITVTQVESLVIADQTLERQSCS